MKRQIVALMVVVSLLAVGNAWGETVNFDFDAGLGPNFTKYDDSGLWNVSTVGQNVRISKLVDDCSVNRYGGISAGMWSRFTLEGDFSLTVDFALSNLPLASGSNGLNEAILGVRSVSDANTVAEVLRFTKPTVNMIELWANPPCGAFGAVKSNLANGRFRLERCGALITASYAQSGSSSFTTIASANAFSDDVAVFLQGTEFTNGSSMRSNTAMDIAFDNLIVEADSITGWVPEPSTFALLGVGAIGLLGWAWRRRKRIIA